MGGDHFPEKGGGKMVTYLELIKLLIDFESFIAISLGTIMLSPTEISSRPPQLG